MTRASACAGKHVVVAMFRSVGGPYRATCASTSAPPLSSSSARKEARSSGAAAATWSAEPPASLAADGRLPAASSVSAHANPPLPKSTATLPPPALGSAEGWAVAAGAGAARRNDAEDLDAEAEAGVGGGKGGKPKKLRGSTS